MKFLSRLSAAALSLGLLAASSLAHAEYISVARASVTMRAGPGTQHEALWTLSQGYPLEVTGRQGKWLKVRDFEKDGGWIYKPLTDDTPHHIVKAKIVNLRKGPGSQHGIVGKAAYGEILRHTEERKEWVKVRNEQGVSGWVSRRLLWGW